MRGYHEIRKAVALAAGLQLRDDRVDRADEDGGHLQYLVDRATSREYGQGPIPGAWFAIRSDLTSALMKLPTAEAIVFISPDGVLARLTAAHLAHETRATVTLLAGDTKTWVAAGYPLEGGATHMASEPVDVVLLARERGQNREEAMREYLAWKIALVNDMATDDDQRFRVIA